MNARFGGSRWDLSLLRRRLEAPTSRLQMRVRGTSVAVSTKQYRSEAVLGTCSVTPSQYGYAA